MAEARSDAKQYEILRRLAVGGMAEIYLARASGMGGFKKHLVIKKVKPEYAADPHFIAMFLDEARLAARLHHQNIAQVYDIGSIGGAHFFSMEYLHGEDCWELFKTFRGSGVPLQHAVTIIAGVAAGLHYAHNKTTDKGDPLGVIHRDVTPTNIIVTYEGAVKLVDFGVARAAERQGKSQTGMLKGKLSYMAPEQLIGSQYDHRADVYAAGKVLFELTTGYRLFAQNSNESDYQLMSRIVSGKFPAPSRLRSDYPPVLEGIVLKALAGEPDERYQSGAELLSELETFAANNALPLSQTALGQFMVTTFGRRPEPWLEEPEMNEETVTVKLVDLPDFDDTGTLKSDEWAVVAGRLDAVEWTPASHSVTPMEVDTERRVAVTGQVDSAPAAQRRLKAEPLQPSNAAGRGGPRRAATARVVDAAADKSPRSVGSGRQTAITVIGLVLVMAVGLLLGLIIGRSN